MTYLIKSTEGQHQTVIAEKLVGQQLGPYIIEAILGRGGMAVVYRARSLQGEGVALKVLFPPPAASQEILARFEREARTAAQLNHPAIVRVLDVGQADGHAYLAMRLISGITLADRLAVAGSLDEATAAEFAWQIADALDYAHRQGVVHRDVKPSNILLTDDNRAWLTDFGVALALDDVTLTHTGTLLAHPPTWRRNRRAGKSALMARPTYMPWGWYCIRWSPVALPSRAAPPKSCMPTYLSFTPVRSGPPLTSLLRTEDSVSIFLIADGQRRSMPNGPELWALGYGIEDISVVPAEFLEHFSLAATPSTATPTPHSD